jgi:hypothetical protein
MAAPFLAQAATAIAKNRSEATRMSMTNVSRNFQAPIGGRRCE